MPHRDPCQSVFVTSFEEVSSSAGGLGPRGGRARGAPDSSGLGPGLRVLGCAPSERGRGGCVVVVVVVVW